FAVVLGVDRVGVYDNFFALGGDSILSLQVVARARREGVVVTSRDVFARQCVAALAEVAVVEEAAGGGVDGGAVSVPVPLTRIMRRFFDGYAAGVDHFAMSVLVELVEGVDREASGWRWPRWPTGTPCSDCVSRTVRHASTTP